MCVQSYVMFHNLRAKERACMNVGHSLLRSGRRKEVPAFLSDRILPPFNCVWISTFPARSLLSNCTAVIEERMSLYGH